jgi:carbamoyl-phosphate synthase large subunit
MTRQPCVLVTGVGGRSVGHQILHALLLLGDKYLIVATDADAFSFGLYEVDSRYLVPFTDDTNYIPAILHIVEREGVDVILPGTQPEVRVLAEHKDTLATLGCIVLASPAKVVQLCSNKERLYNWLDANGFRVPRTAPAAEWRSLVAEVGFPLVGKPTEHSGGSRNVTILKDEAEVEHYLAESQIGYGEVILQEYVGAPDGEYTVGVLVSKTGELIDSIVVHRKLVGLSLGTKRIINGRTYTLSTGYSQGFIVRHSLIQQCCENLSLKLGIRGPVNIQCRLVGDEVKVFEVHPRFSGTTSIRADAGFNEPDILIRNYLFDEPFGRLDYQTDVAAIRAFRSLLVPISVMQSVSRISSYE